MVDRTFLCRFTAPALPPALLPPSLQLFIEGVLDADGITTSATQDIKFLFGQPAAAGDGLDLDANGTLIINNYVMTSGDMGDTEETFPGVALPVGTWALRGKVRRSGYSDSIFGPTLNVERTAAVGYSAEATAYFARIGTAIGSTDPGTTRKDAAAALIDGLVAAGLWTNMKAFYLFATNTEANAKINLKSASYPITNVGETFTADRGLVGADAGPVTTTKHLQTGFNPSTQMSSPNAASYGVWSNTATAPVDGGCLMGGGAGGGASVSLWCTGATFDVYARVNDNSVTITSGSTPANGAGFFAMNRSGASASEAYWGDTSLTTLTPPNEAVISAVNAPISFGGFWDTNSGGVIAFGSPAELALGYMYDGSLSSTQVDTVRGLAKAYRVAIGLDVGGGGAYSAEATAYFARCPSTISDTNKGYINTFINGLITDGIWAKLDAIWLLAQSHYNNTLLNLKSSAFTLTEVGTPGTWVAYEGWTGNALSQALDTHLTPSTVSGNYSANNMHMGFFINVERGDEVWVPLGVLDGGGPTYIQPKESPSVTGWGVGLNYIPGSTATTVKGMWLATHRGISISDASELYYKGVSVTQYNEGGAGACTASFFIGAWHNGTGSHWSGDQIAMVTLGGALTDTDAANYSARVETYMTAITSGGALPPATNIWNAADCSPGITVSGTPALIAANTGSFSPCSGRATVGRSTGKVYWEIQYTGVIGHTYSGFGNSASALTWFITSSFDSVGLTSGYLGYNSADASGGAAPTFVTGDIIGFALDFGAKRLWVRKNDGTWFSGDPAAGTGGYDVAACIDRGGPFYAMYTMDEPPNGQTANFGQTAYAHVGPTGFDNWG